MAPKIIAAMLSCLLLCGCVFQTVIPESGMPETSQNPETQSSVQMSESTPPEPADGEFVRIADYIPEIVTDLKYAAEDNFTGKVVYDFTQAYARYGTVKKLKKASDALNALGYGLKIWDAYRPLSAQQRLWDICPDPTYVSNPQTGNRSHCRGNAIDLTLIRLDTGEEVETPTGFDDFTALADRDYSDCSDAAAQNAKLLEAVMIAAGFNPYSAEWWHYSDVTDYPVEENFVP